MSEINTAYQYGTAGMFGYDEIPILDGFVHRPVFFSPGPENFGAAWDFWRAKKRTYIYNIYTLRARAQARG